MNNICKISIDTVKAFLFENKNISIDFISKMPPLFFHFEHEKQNTDILYKLYEPIEILEDIGGWGSLTANYYKHAENTGCVITAIAEDDDTSTLYFMFSIYENIAGGGRCNSFRCDVKEILNEDIKYEWFDINNFCHDFGMTYH